MTADQTVKLKKVNFEKKFCIFLCFWKWDFLATRLKISRRELSELEKQKKTYSEKILIFWEMELSCPKLKKIYFFFLKQVFIYFRKEFASSKLKELLIKLIYTLTKTP